MITSGCWPNSGMALTMPSTLTMRFTLIEVAELGLHHRDQAEAGLARVLVGLLDGEVAADLAGRQRLARQARPLAGEIEQVAGAHGVDVVRHRRVGLASSMPSSFSRCSVFMEFLSERLHAIEEGADQIDRFHTATRFDARGNIDNRARR